MSPGFVIWPRIYLYHLLAQIETMATRNPPASADIIAKTLKETYALYGVPGNEAEVQKTLTFPYDPQTCFFPMERAGLPGLMTLGTGKFTDDARGIGPLVFERTAELAEELHRAYVMSAFMAMLSKREDLTPGLHIPNAIYIGPGSLRLDKTLPVLGPVSYFQRVVIAELLGSDTISIFVGEITNETPRKIYGRIFYHSQIIPALDADDVGKQTTAAIEDKWIRTLVLYDYQGIRGNLEPGKGRIRIENAESLKKGTFVKPATSFEDLLLILIELTSTFNLGIDDWPGVANLLKGRLADGKAWARAILALMSIPYYIIDETKPNPPLPPIPLTQKDADELDAVTYSLKAAALLAAPSPTSSQAKITNTITTPPITLANRDQEDAADVDVWDD